MRLVKIQLADSPFWFLGKLVNLTQENRMSDFLNVDSLPDEEKTIINKSARIGEIRIYDPENRRLKTIDESDYISGEYAVDIDDIKDDESDTVPEVFSVTVNNDKDEDEDKNPTKADYEEAQILLNKNGNTVKKIIKQIPKTTDGLLLLHACLETEKANQSRAGVVNTIEKCIVEF